jgi:hypothetical protein
MEKLTTRHSFYAGKRVPRTIGKASTVGELRELLLNYPDKLPLFGDEGAQLIWFNVGSDSEHLCIESNDGDWDEPWDEPRRGS